VTDQNHKRTDDGGLGGPRLGLHEDDIMPTDGQWHGGEFAGAKYEVRITDQGGLIPINKVDEAVLTKIVTNLLLGPNSQVQGVDRRAQQNVSEIVDSILDWRDPDSLKRMHGAESEYYLSTKRAYPAKNGFFDDAQELLLVRGVTASLYYGGDGVPGLRDVISTFNRSGQLNVRSMKPEVVQALIGCDAATAEDMIAQRDSDPETFLATLSAQLVGINGPEDSVDGFLVNAPAHTVAVEARADTSQQRNQSNVAAVIELSADEFDGPKVLRWVDRAPWTGPLPTGRIGDQHT
jgi:hypothetical protein